MARDNKQPQKAPNRKRLPLSANRAKTKKKKNDKAKDKSKPIKDQNLNNGDVQIQPLQSLSSAGQLNFFVQQFQSANGIKLSPLELESIKDSCILKLSEEPSQDAINLGKHMKTAFGSSWKEVLCEGELVEGKIDAGNPVVVIISISAIRSLELLRGLRALTKECQAVKLFSKHLKVEEQVELLKKRVNIASGTPSRIKKLCELDALGFSRLNVIVLDMHTDVKGYSLLTLPQIRDEFWDLYKLYFHQRLAQGNLRICLYGPFLAPVECVQETQEHSN